MAGLGWVKQMAMKDSPGCLFLLRSLPEHWWGLLAQVGLASMARGVTSTCSRGRDGEHSAHAPSPIPGVIAKPNFIIVLCS